MAVTVIEPEKLGGAELAISPTLTTLRTTPSNSKDMVKDIVVSNNGSSIAIVDLFLVESGGSADAGNIFLPGISIPINSVFQWTGLQLLDPGDTIQARSGIAGVSCRISGGVAV